MGIRIALRQRADDVVPRVRDAAAHMASDSPSPARTATRRALSAVLAVALSSSTFSVFAQDAVVYRCTDAKGALTIQNGTPCPKGARQERRVIAAPTVVPAYVAPTPTASPGPTPGAPLPALSAAPAAAPVERPPSEPVVQIADADRLPPPPIYQCNTWDNDSYTSESAEVPPRCVRIAVDGVGGNPDLAAGEACEMKTDQCQRVADGAACDAWKKRQREIEGTWRYAKAADKAPLQEDFARVSRILGESTCGKL